MWHPPSYIQSAQGNTCKTGTLRRWRLMTLEGQNGKCLCLCLCPVHTTLTHWPRPLDFNQPIKFKIVPEWVEMLKITAMRYLPWSKAIYACKPHKMLPQNPAFPKNSVDVWCFTKCSSVTLLIAYKVALDNYNPKQLKSIFNANSTILNLHRWYLQSSCGFLQEMKLFSPTCLFKRRYWLTRCLVVVDGIAPYQ